MGKKSRKPEYYTCPMCYRRLRLNGVKIPRHMDSATATLCDTSGGFVPGVVK